MTKDRMGEEIRRLKAEKDAIILAHNYQIAEVQDLADFTGDSLGLSIEASKTDASIIVFCGVHFMAETAKMLNPAKKVLMPDRQAGCPMADMIQGQQLQDLRKLHPGAKVVCYINSTAEVKALSDICCTSGNAVSIVRSLGEQEIIFVPDRHLGSFVEQKLQKKIILWDGYCNIHAQIRPSSIEARKKEHPQALVMAHPECPSEVRDLADFVDSTSRMLTFPSQTEVEEFIVATEIGILHPLKKQYPKKRFYPAESSMVCPDMKQTSMEKLLHCLEQEKEEILVEEGIARKALGCIQRMLAVR